MTTFTITNLRDHNTAEWLQEFAELGLKVRAFDYKIGVTNPEQTTKIVTWGLTLNTDFWLVKDQNQKSIVRLGAHASKNLKDTGTIGFFEADLTHPQIEEAITLAINTAETWLKSQGVKSIAAPVDINTWFQYRFSMGGGGPRFKWEPTTPPEYEAHFKRLGYSNFAHYHSSTYPYIKILFWYLGFRPIQKSYKNLIKQGFTLRPFNLEKFLEVELPVIYEICNETFKDSLMFEPIDYNVFKMIYASALQSYDFSPSCMLLDENKQPAGFIFSFYDGDFLVIKSMAIRNIHHGKKLATGLIYHSVKESFPRKTKMAISALVRSGIMSEKIEQSRQKGTGFRWKHEYVLLKKDLP